MTLVAVAILECRGEPSARLTLDAKWPGFRRGLAKSVAISGDYAYLAADDLQVIDLRDRSNPTRVGWCRIWNHPSERATRVAIRGNHAFLAAGNAGLVVVDITAPDDPKQVGSYRTLGASGVAIAGTLVQVADATGMTLIDVSDPARPLKVGSYIAGFAKAVDVAGTLAYLASADAGLHVVDISNPTAPFKAGEVHLNGVPNDIRVVGGYAYLAASGLEIVDVKDAARPASVGRSETTGLAHGVAVSGSRAYLADASGYPGGEGVIIFDIGDPMAPKRIGRCDVGGTGGAYGLALSGDRFAFIAANHRDGFQVFDVDAPDQARRLGAYQPWGESLEAAAAGSHVYVADGLHGLQIIDASDPGNPRRVARGDAFAASVMVSGSHAYLVTKAEDSGDSQFAVLDIADPSRPTALGRCGLKNSPWNMIAGAGHVYLAGREGLSIVEVVDPTRPREVGVFATPETTWSVALSGSQAYLAADAHGLLIVDVHDPSRLRLVGRYVDQLAFAFGVAASGSNALLADGGRLRIVDASLPDAPREIGSCAVPGARSVVVSGHYAFVARLASATDPEQGGLSMVDVTDSAHPTVVASTSGFDGWTVTVAGDRAMVAARQDGLALVEIQAGVQFDSMGFMPDGFRFMLRGLPDQKVRLQRSVDLRHWENWIDTALVAAQVQITDSEAGTNSLLFYRAIVPKGAFPTAIAPGAAERRRP